MFRSCLCRACPHPDIGTVNDAAKTGQPADLELRHRGRARCDDRTAKDTGLRNLPLHGYAQNQIWCQIVALARAPERRNRRE